MNVSTNQQRIATLAALHPQRSFTSLNQYLTYDWLLVAYRKTRKNGAAGVDSVTSRTYGGNLEANLKDLLERVKSGRYKAPPVLRHYIPKGKSGHRPIGIPTFEDKILQRAVVMILEPIYEQEFIPGSYGFRPGRSAHQALQQLRSSLMAIEGGVVIDVDIQSFFDDLDHAHLRSFLQYRVSDGVILRLIGKWLKAGVMEDGQVHFPGSGSPQGGVVSPLLSNIYLHYVLDLWFEHTVKPRLKGRAELVRFADDFVITCAEADDAARVMDVLPNRFARYGLCLHPQKTRKLDFRKPDKGDPIPDGFDFLGFTHFWGQSRYGQRIVKQKTAKDRLRRTITSIGDWCKKNRHLPVRVQHHKLCQKLTGHYGYFGITGNIRCLRSVLCQAQRSWQKWLNRRNRENRMPWRRFQELLKVYSLPPARIVHSYCR
jgi:group II intron reverse transcriptase/maturase